MPLPKEHPRLFDHRHLPRRYPLPTGHVGATPTRWRYSDAELEPLRDFLADLAWAMGEDADMHGGSQLGPLRVLMRVAQLWGLDTEADRWPHPRYGQLNNIWQIRKDEDRGIRSRLPLREALREGT